MMTRGLMETLETRGTWAAAKRLELRLDPSKVDGLEMLRPKVRVHLRPILNVETVTTGAKSARLFFCVFIYRPDPTLSIFLVKSAMRSAQMVAPLFPQYFNLRVNVRPTLVLQPPALVLSCPLDCRWRRPYVGLRPLFRTSFLIFLAQMRYGISLLLDRKSVV